MVFAQKDFLDQIYSRLAKTAGNELDGINHTNYLSYKKLSLDFLGEVEVKRVEDFPDLFKKLINNELLYNSQKEISTDMLDIAYGLTVYSKRKLGNELRDIFSKTMTEYNNDLAETRMESFETEGSIDRRKELLGLRDKIRDFEARKRVDPVYADTPKLNETLKEVEKLTKYNIPYKISFKGMVDDIFKSLNTSREVERTFKRGSSNASYELAKEAISQHIDDMQLAKTMAVIGVAAKQGKALEILKTLDLEPSSYLSV